MGFLMYKPKIAALKRRISFFRAKQRKLKKEMTEHEITIQAIKMQIRDLESQAKGVIEVSDDESTR